MAAVEPMTRYELEIEVRDAPDDPDGIRRLRAALKALWRVYKVRCCGVRPAVTEEQQQETNA